MLNLVRGENIKRRMSTKLSIFATHPVQYHVPIWRKLAATPELQVQVYYFSDHSVRGGIDPGFGVPVAWDIPLLEGYKYSFISRWADLSRPHTIQIPEPRKIFEKGCLDWVLIQGYTRTFERQVVRFATTMGYKVLMRGEFTDVPRRRNRLKRHIRDLYLLWFYKHVDAFCYIGKEALRHLQRRGIPTTRMFYSPYSVDSQLLEAQVRKFRRKECRESLGLSEDTFVFLFSGKMIPRKMPLILVEAVRRMGNNKLKFRTPKWGLTAYILLILLHF